MVKGDAAGAGETEPGVWVTSLSWIWEEEMVKGPWEEARPASWVVGLLLSPARKVAAARVP